MPIFKSTQNIFTDNGEVFDPNWMDSDKLILPPKEPWDYKREMNIEDVDVWELVYEQGGGVGVYAAWHPYAEFYLIRTGWWNAPDNIETYYGAGAQKLVQKRMKELGMRFNLHQHWVEPEDMWLYQ
jgi:hypothetical protein